MSNKTGLFFLALLVLPIALFGQETHKFPKYYFCTKTTS